MNATSRRHRVKRVSTLAGVCVFLYGGLAFCEVAELRRICSGEVLVFDEPSFDVFDIDTDDLLSEDETDACTTLQAVFEELDLDADEALTEQEYLAFAQIWRQRKSSFGDRE
jgi:hypothetical protein